MFSASMYRQRRERLRKGVQSGVILLPGNSESPMNYADNPYPFRQDSSFLYFLGLDLPNLVAVIDVDSEQELVFGNDLTVEDLVWMGRQPALRELCEESGVQETLPLEKLEPMLCEAARGGRTVHFLPQYRAENALRIAQVLGIALAEIAGRVSASLVSAVVTQRSVKSQEEIGEIEAALDITHEMHTLAMKMTKPGVYEREVVGLMEGTALSKGGHLAFPTIFSIHGEILHNHYHGNRMSAGDIVVNDSGAESPSHYASDITRTIPVSGRFTEKQREIYSIVLDAQKKAIEAIRPGIEFREVHRLASKILVAGLKELGITKGDPDEAVEAGAHTLFFPCGLGHMMGLDVHDMEGLGEDSVGYTETIKRKPEFGWRSLRLAKALEPGFVITVEPGIYFIPELIDRWEADKRCSEFVNYSKLDEYKQFGGIRIEDDALVLQGGCRTLGKRIPRTVEEIEDAMSNAGGR